MRLSTAQQLLRQSKISLVDVAFKCGFSSQTHMNENLLAELGVLRSAVIRRMEGRKPQGCEI
jgi:transcriptional regulator GlxA family with amidase domain